MDQISGILLRRLRIAELIQFLLDVLGITIKAGPAALGLDARTNMLTASVNTLENLYKQDSGSDVTDELVAIDDNRDRAYIGIRDYCKAILNHFNPVKANAARLLLNNLALYGDELNRKAFQEQTSIFRNFINDWQSRPELKEAVLELQLTEWIQYLAAQNDSFAERYVARAQERGGVTPDAVNQGRLAAYQAYKRLRDAIVSHATLNEGASGEPYRQLIRDFNGIIKNYNNALARRGGRTNDEESLNDEPDNNPAGA